MRQALVLVTGLLCSGASQAATLSQDFGTASGPGYFSPAIIERYHGRGKLTSVQIAYQAGVFIYGRLTPSDPDAPSYEVDIAGMAGIVFLNTYDSQVFSEVQAYPSSDYYTTPTYAFDGFYQPPASNLGLFVGSGQFELLSEGTEAATSPSGHYTILSDAPSTFATGRIIYTFGTVPEPSTWSMIIGGIVLVGGTMRRRQRTGRACASERR